MSAQCEKQTCGVGGNRSGNLFPQSKKPVLIELASGKTFQNGE